MQKMQIYFADWMPGMPVEVAWNGHKWRPSGGHTPHDRPLKEAEFNINVVLHM
jgi:hypothetical protein